MRRHIVFVLAAWICFMRPTLAQDCDEVPPDVALARARVVFRGKVVSIKHLNFATDPDGHKINRGRIPHNDRAAITFEADTVWKGPIRKSFTVYGIMRRTMGADYDYEIGKTYIVYARDIPGFRDLPELGERILSVGTFCTFRYVSENFERDLLVLGKGVIPK